MSNGLQVVMMPILNYVPRVAPEICNAPQCCWQYHEEAAQVGIAFPAASASSALWRPSDRAVAAGNDQEIRIIFRNASQPSSFTEE
jgi:hypothetical protein